ncbi:MAG: hypothetical protein AAF389_03170 [Gemmatimonadota bacterium]
MPPALTFLVSLPLLAGWAPWGGDGHEMAARAAVDVLPTEMPAFFLEAGDQLVWLDPEPDRWRDRDRREMDAAGSFDHYIDFENLPAGALDAPDRFSYLAELFAAGLSEPARDGGFLPYRIVELYQRLASLWERWQRTEPGSDERGWIEQRILNDAGILGHYVTDGSQPHHTTIHFNGWASGAPNPEGYTEDRGFHARFETAFVSSHLEYLDVRGETAAPSARPADVRYAVLDYLWTTHEHVDRLYALDRDVGFDPFAPAAPDAEAFAAERLGAGASMLAKLWWWAWLESEM